MRNFTQEEAKVIYNDAKKKGLNPDKVMSQLVLQGATFDGVDMNQAKQYAQSQVPQTEALKPTFKEKINEAFGDIEQVGKDVAESGMKRAENIDEAQNARTRGEQGTLRTLGQTFGQFMGAGADAITAAGKGAVNVFLSDKSEKAVTDVIGKFGTKVMANPEVQNIINKYNSLPEEQQRDIDAVGGVLDLVSNFIGGGAVSKGAGIAETGVRKTMQVAGDIADTTGTAIKETGENIVSKVVPKSDEIMNRVARLTPKQATEFERLAGKTHGEYLRETGNFGTPDEILKNEATKFAQSIKSVDDTLATLPGVYKDGSLTDAIMGLKEKAIETSSANVKSPILSKVLEFETKLNNEGLTMSEINELKRLYEREVKLGYKGVGAQINSRAVDKATYIDEAIREWQVNKAKELGFENIAELNKQTQLSKFILNKLGDQVVGKSGLDNIGLTDWIMLSGGDPTAVGGFLTKKFFSSKSVQSKIAKMLNKGEVKGQITPKVTPSKQLPQQSVKIESQKALPKSSTNSTKASSSLSPKDKQAGFISIGGKKFAQVPEATKKEMVQVIDYLRTGKSVKNIEDTLSKLAQKYNINQDLPNAKIANYFEDLLDKTKTGSVKLNPLNTIAGTTVGGVVAANVYNKLKKKNGKTR